MADGRTTGARARAQLLGQTDVFGLVVVYVRLSLRGAA
jgi:hypothetical protein